MCRSLLNLMEGMDSHLREKLLNAAKMFMFLLFESLRSLEERFNSKTDKELAVDAKVTQATSYRHKVFLIFLAFF